MLFYYKELYTTRFLEKNPKKIIRKDAIRIMPIDKAPITTIRAVFIL
ncbi:MAG: hypothetical protein ABH843_07040 [Candidatus Omnitrophota bacterium]